MPRGQALQRVARGARHHSLLRRGLPEQELEGLRGFHIILLRPQKLAFCALQKVGSEHFGPLFAGAANPSFLQEVRNATDPVQVFNSNYDEVRLMSSGLAWQQLTRENGWSFAFFTRDPLQRYLSAFLSKCTAPGPNLSPPSGGRDCFGPILDQAAGPVSLEQKRAAFEQRAARDAASGLAQDDHWKGQFAILKDIGGLERFGPGRADFEGSLSLPDVTGQVAAMLGGAGVPNAAELARFFFPPRDLEKRRSQIQCPSTHCTDADEELETFYANPETVKNVLRLLCDDYTQLQLPLPAFAASRLGNATAEEFCAAKA
mmetsp:Transcript_64843/g.201025  ORF Transcript_64843/g.201025 Transcript_64843/m.201025 type:complete len:317 (-) Transcript_64843:69-1019(-)